jgi:hypothetical protein
MSYKKKFLVIGNNNTIIRKDTFPLIKSGKIFLGYSSNTTMEFRVPDNYKFSREDATGKYGKVPAIS